MTEGDKIRIFGRHNLEEIFKRRSSYPNGKHYVNLVGLHDELNEIAEEALKKAEERGLLRGAEIAENYGQKIGHAVIHLEIAQAIRKESEK